MTDRPAAWQLDVVVPCFNEQDALPVTAPVMLAFFRDLIASPANRLAAVRLIFVDDGSEDFTWEIIAGLCAAHPEVTGLRLSRNFGHQAAMLAGLAATTADAVLTLDADLQDDLGAASQMIAAFESGAHLALGVRNDRTTDTRIKRRSASLYYRLLRLLGVDVIHNHADYRLMSRTALDALLAYEEVNLFLRGLIPTIGFPVVIVPYRRQARAAGATKYTWRKMARLALDGITSFSITPLRLIAASGLVVFVGTLLLSGFFIVLRLIDSQRFVPGWASTVLPVLLLGGMQLLSTGVLGEYVGKIYLETKRRPRFVIQERRAHDRRDSDAPCRSADT